MYEQWKRRGYSTPVDTLMYCGVLTKQDYEDWRFGRISYLEKSCKANLKKLSFILHQMKIAAEKNKWKPSYCCYKQWGIKKKSGQGHKPVIRLRFSKSNDSYIEQLYSTHYVDAVKINELKMAQNTIKNSD